MFRYVKEVIACSPMPRGGMYDPERLFAAYPKEMNIDKPEPDPNSWQAKADEITKAALKQMQAAGLDVEMAISDPNIIGGVFKIRNATCAKVKDQIYAEGGLFDGKPIYEVRALNTTKFEFGLFVTSHQLPASAE